MYFMMHSLRQARNPHMSKLITKNTRKLTAAQFQQLSDVPPEMEWFANIDNKHPRAAYRNDIKKYRGQALN